jgi:hypothetical protein
MLSLTECKKKLNKNGVQFTDAEIEMIRNVLYKLAEVCHAHINKKIKNLNKTTWSNQTLM